jgi:hypothetical protein
VKVYLRALRSGYSKFAGLCLALLSVVPCDRVVGYLECVTGPCEAFALLNLFALVDENEPSTVVESGHAVAVREALDYLFMNLVDSEDEMIVKERRPELCSSFSSECFKILLFGGRAGLCRGSMVKMMGGDLAFQVSYSSVHTVSPRTLSFYAKFVSVLSCLELGYLGSREIRESALTMQGALSLLDSTPRVRPNIGREEVRVEWHLFNRSWREFLRGIISEDVFLALGEWVKCGGCVSGHAQERSGGAQKCDTCFCESCCSRLADFGFKRDGVMMRVHHYDGDDEG